MSKEIKFGFDFIKVEQDFQQRFDDACTMVTDVIRTKYLEAVCKFMEKKRGEK